MTQGPNDPVSLEYATAPSRRRRWLVQGLVVLIALVAGGAATQYAPAVWTRIRQIYWQRQCMKFTAPAGTVVFQRVVNGVLIKAPPDYTDADNLPKSWGLFGGGGSGTQPTVPSTVGFAPQCFANRLEAFGETFGGSAVAFCHERSSPAGHRRLVTVLFFESASSLDDSFLGWLWGSDGSSIPMTEQPHKWKVDYDPGQPSQVEAGQFDPNDASHFTIAYQWPDGVRGIVDGWLLDDDTVKCVTREGPGDIPSTKARILKAKIDALKFRPESWPAN